MVLEVVEVESVGAGPSVVLKPAVPAASSVDVGTANDEPVEVGSAAPIRTGVLAALEPSQEGLVPVASRTTQSSSSSSSPPFPLTPSAILISPATASFAAPVRAPEVPLPDEPEPARPAAEPAELDDEMEDPMPLAMRKGRSRRWWESSVIGGRSATAGRRDGERGRVSVAEVVERRVRETMNGNVVCILEFEPSLRSMRVEFVESFFWKYNGYVSVRDRMVRMEMKGMPSQYIPNRHGMALCKVNRRKQRGLESNDGRAP